MNGMTAVSSYRGLSILLWLLSVVAAIAGLLLIFASHWVLSLAPASLVMPGSIFVTIFLRAIGILALALAYLACVTARDPVRYASLIDAFIFILLALSILDVYALVVLNVGQYYPAHYVVGRVIVRVALAIALIWMRPRSTARNP